MTNNAVDKNGATLTAGDRVTIEGVEGEFAFCIHSRVREAMTVVKDDSLFYFRVPTCFVSKVMPEPPVTPSPPASRVVIDSDGDIWVANDREVWGLVRRGGAGCSVFFDESWRSLNATFGPLTHVVSQE